MAIRIPVLRLALTAAAAATLEPAAASERLPKSMAEHPRLAPVEAPIPPLEGYEADLKRAFREAFGPDVRLRAIVRPSFEAEYAVTLRRTGDGHEIFAMRPVSQQVWAYQMAKLLRSGRAGVMHIDLTDPKSVPRDDTADEISRLEKDLPPDPADLALHRCAVPVDGRLAGDLAGAWRSMLEEVRPDEELMPGVDGTTYVFSMESGGRALGGQSWTPREGTRPARLARLAEAMLSYCLTRKAAPLGRIRTLARELAAARSG